MSEEREYTFAQAFGGSRDMCCIAAVGDMAEMGRFDEEFHMYGCASLDGGKITYRVTPLAEQIYQFTSAGAVSGYYPTRVHSYSESLPVPVGMRTGIERSVKLKLARHIQTLYPASYFMLLQPFCEVSADNSSQPLLERLKEAVEGYFEEAICQLFEGTVQIAYAAKHLNRDSYRDFQHWLANVRRQMEDTPVIQSGMPRTFYGFCYQKGEGAIKTIVNAQAISVWEQRGNLERQGYLVGPILRQEQWFDETADISEGRMRFKQTVQSLENASYFDYLQTLQALPSVIDTGVFQHALEELTRTEMTTAIEDFYSYGYRWNCL